MKTGRLAICLFISLQGCIFATPSPTSSFSIPSPDHPQTWFTYYYDKLDQRLRWSDKDRTLYLAVTYSLAPYTDGDDPTQYTTFWLKFPSVRLDDARGRFYHVAQDGSKVDIGRRVSGPFGDRVVLNKNVHLSAHRKNDELKAKLIVTAPPSLTSTLHNGPTLATR